MQELVNAHPQTLRVHHLAVHFLVNLVVAPGIVIAEKYRLNGLRGFIDCKLDLRISHKVAVLLGIMRDVVHRTAFIVREVKELGGKAKEIYHELSRHFMCTYDDAGSIGKRYRRQDEIGTPYCVTIDFDTLENDTVTVRDRDTMEQIRIPVKELAAYVEEKIKLY